MRQCGTVTMTTYPVHAHRRPPNISLPALPGLTFTYHHLDIFCRYKCHNIPFVSQNVSHQVRSKQASYGHMGMSEKILLFLVNRWAVCIVRYFPTLYKYTEHDVVSLTNYTDCAWPAWSCATTILLIFCPLLDHMSFKEIPLTLFHLSTITAFQFFCA